MLASIISPAIAPTTPTFDATTGGVDYGYEITAERAAQATTIDLYWASGTTTDTEIGDPIATTTTDGAGDLCFAGIGLRPDGSTEGAEYLLAVADPDNDISPADPSKVASLPLLEIPPRTCRSAPTVA